MKQPITLADLADRLTTILSDPALTSAFKAKCPALEALLNAVPADVVRKVEPLPGIAAITAVQAAVFDNWPRGHPVKSYPNRYALAVEVWTAPADEIEVARLKDYQHKCSFGLMDAKTLRDWATRTTRQNPTRKHPLSEAYLADLVVAADALTPGQFIGVCCAKVHGEGTVYFDDQWVLVEISGPESVATLFIQCEPLQLAPFSEVQANGKPHGGNVILQSRTDRVGFSSNWSTAERANVVQFQAA